MTLKIISVGTPFRRDDGAGPAVLRKLNPRTGVELIETSADVAQLMAAWEGADKAIVIDASAPAGSPGKISRIIVGEDALPSESPVASTHAFGLAKAIELADALGERPREIIIYAIEGEDFGHGEGCSPAVEKAIPILAGKIEKEIETLTGKAMSDA